MPILSPLLQHQCPAERKCSPSFTVKLYQFNMIHIWSCQYWQYIENTKQRGVCKLLEVAAIVRFIKAQRIKWLKHIQRMDQARPARKLLDWKPMGIRPVGRPRQRWQEDVMEDLKKLKVKNWKETAKDRRTWRYLAEKAKTHKVL